MTERTRLEELQEKYPMGNKLSLDPRPWHGSLHPQASTYLFTSATEADEELGLCFWLPRPGFEQNREVYRAAFASRRITQ